MSVIPQAREKESLSMPTRTGVPYLIILIILVILMAGTLLATAGCTTTPPASTRSFSLSLYVDGQDDSTNPLAQTARYLVLANRQLHVMLGQAARQRTYPKPYRALRVDEFDRVVRFVDEHHLLAEPTSPAVREMEHEGRSDLPVRYELTVTRNGRTNRYVTTPEESPPTTALLAALSSFRGADLSKASVPE